MISVKTEIFTEIGIFRLYLRRQRRRGAIDEKEAEELRRGRQRTTGSERSHHAH